MKLVWSRDGKIDILEVDPLADPDPGPAKSFRQFVLEKSRSQKLLYVLFDLANADFPDRMAVVDLLWCHRLLKQHGGAIMLLSPIGQLWENLQREGATNLIPYRWDKAEALRDYREAIEAGDVIDRLLFGNRLTYRPSLLMKVRRFSAAALNDPSEEEIPIPSADDLEKEPVAAPAPEPPPPSEASKPTPESLRADWNLTMEVYHTAASLARKHDVPFDQTMSFEDFMAAMGEKLT